MEKVCLHPFIGFEFSEKLKKGKKYLHQSEYTEILRANSFLSTYIPELLY